MEITYKEQDKLRTVTIGKKYVFFDNDKQNVSKKPKALSEVRFSENCVSFKALNGCCWWKRIEEPKYWYKGIVPHGAFLKTIFDDSGYYLIEDSSEDSVVLISPNLYRAVYSYQYVYEKFHWKYHFEKDWKPCDIENSVEDFTQKF